MIELCTFRKEVVEQAIQCPATADNPQIVDYQALADALGWTIGELSGRWPQTLDNGAERRGQGRPVPMTAFPGMWVIVELGEDPRIVGVTTADYFEQPEWERVR